MNKIQKFIHEIKQEFNHFKETIENGTPIVMFDRVAKTIDCDKIITDDFNGALNTVEYLHKTGHRNIAFVSTLSNLHIGEQRFLGYKKGLENVGLPFNENLIVNILNQDYKEYESILIPLFKNNKIDKIRVILKDLKSKKNSKEIALQKIYHQEMIKMISDFKKHPTKLGSSDGFIFLS